VTYNILYCVTGGAAGARDLLLRDGDSTRPKVFETLEAAEAEIESLSRINRPFSLVHFRYRAVRAEN